MKKEENCRIRYGKTRAEPKGLSDTESDVEETEDTSLQGAFTKENAPDAFIFLPKYRNVKNERSIQTRQVVSETEMSTIEERKSSMSLNSLQSCVVSKRLIKSKAQTVF